MRRIVLGLVLLLAIVGLGGLWAQMARPQAQATDPVFGTSTQTTTGATTGAATNAPPLATEPMVEATGSTYFVAVNGTDGAAGSETAPWRTLQYAVDAVAPGDTILVRGGTYTAGFVVGVSGTAVGGWITLRNYPNEHPVIDGSTITATPENSNLITIEDQSYWRIEGLALRNYQSNRVDVVPIGIYVGGTAHHIQLLSNEIDHIATHASASEANAHGLAVYGTNGSTAVHHLTIANNHLHDLILGNSESMVINGNVQTFTVTQNLVHDNDNIGIDIIGFEGTSPNPATDRARDGLVSLNTVYHIDSSSNPSYGGARAADGIYVDGGRDIVIERNTVYANNIGMEVTSENSGGSAEGVIVRNNWIYHNDVVGISIGGYDPQRGSTFNCTFVNNTFLGNDTLETGSGEFLFQFDAHNNILENNLFFANNQGLLVSSIYANALNNTLDYNLYFAPGNNAWWVWHGTDYNSLAAFRTAVNGESHALLANPLLVNPSTPDLHLQANSPAINAGLNGTAVGGQDGDGGPRIQNGTIDIGADEYGESHIFLPILRRPV